MSRAAARGFPFASGLASAASLSNVLFPLQVLNLNWYAKHARHPFYGELGLNSGVMLMDLDRMRFVSYSHTVEVAPCHAPALPSAIP